MSWDWHRQAPKRAPPQDGIKVKKLGSTWWGQNWIEALERCSRDYLNRLGRGRSYARAGRVHDLKVVPGKVTARVTGSGATPYKVSLAIDAFTPKDWQAAIAAMAKEARFAAELLAGKMPDDIDTVFKTTGHSLFPRKSSDLETDCSCPDWANPCKHVAAVHYVLGEALDRDPFLLFELRGCTKNEVLQALSRLRSDLPDAERVDQAIDTTIPSIEIQNQDPAQYELPPSPLPLLRFSFDSPQPPSAILNSAGTPPGWSLDESPQELFAELYAQSAELARELALATPDESNGTEPSAVRSGMGGKPRKQTRST